MAATRGATPPGKVPEFLVATELIAPPSMVDGAVCRVVGSDRGWWSETWDMDAGAWVKGGCEIREVFKAPPASAANLARFNVPPSDCRDVGPGLPAPRPLPPVLQDFPARPPPDPRRKPQRTTEQDHSAPRSRAWLARPLPVRPPRHTCPAPLEGRRAHGQQAPASTSARGFSGADSRWSLSRFRCRPSAFWWAQVWRG